MKINKYTPPERLKAEVMAKIADDSYADELLSLPETSKRKSRLIPLLSAAAAVTVVVCASVYVLGLGGHKNAADESSGTDEEAAVGSTEDFGDFEEPAEIIKGDGGINNQLSDNSSVSNENDFRPIIEADGAPKNESVPATVTVNGKTISVSASDCVEILKLFEGGESIDLDCNKCTHRYKIQIGEKIYTVHEECGNIQVNGCMLRGISIPALDEIVNKYIN